MKNKEKMKLKRFAEVLYGPCRGGGGGGGGGVHVQKILTYSRENRD